MSRWLIVSTKQSEYDKPYSLEEIKENYGEDLYNKLKSDPVHKWRADNGIELIHKEPTLKELKRIWENWNLMSGDMKEVSDKKSVELFNCTNEEHYKQLLKEYENE